MDHHSFVAVDDARSGRLGGGRNLRFDDAAAAESKTQKQNLERETVPARRYSGQHSHERLLPDAVADDDCSDSDENQY